MRQLKIFKKITNRAEVSLEKYLQEISKIPRVSLQEEVALTQRIKAGDQKALDKLVCANLRFGVSVAKQYEKQGLPLMDLINEANLGLIKAAQRFDETRGFKFITYAVWWARQSVLMALAEQGRIVRLPQNQIGKSNKIGRAKHEFQQEFEREPTLEEIAEILEISERDIKILMISSMSHLSLDAPLTEESETTHLDNLQSYEKSPDEQTTHHDLKIDIAEALSKLSKRESDIIKADFGLNGVTIEHVSSTYSIGKERIHQLALRIAQKLKREKFSADLLKYLG